MVNDTSVGESSRTHCIESFQDSPIAVASSISPITYTSACPSNQRHQVNPGLNSICPNILCHRCLELCSLLVDIKSKTPADWWTDIGKWPTAEQGQRCESFDVSSDNGLELIEGAQSAHIDLHADQEEQALSSVQTKDRHHDNLIDCHDNTGNPSHDDRSNPPPEEDSSAQKFILHRGILQLEDSARRGCHLCTLIWYSFDKLRRKQQEQYATFLAKGDGSVQVLIDTWFLKREEYMLFLTPSVTDGLLNFEGENLKIATSFSDFGQTIKLKPGERTNGSSYRPTEMEHSWSKAYWSFSNASQEAFDLARMWLRSCLSRHRNCAERQSGVLKRPKRLIDVGGGVSHVTRLVEVGESDVEYLTLSHCWGGADIPKLTKENYEMMREQIPADTLSVSFQHAIKVTQMLGYQHIWIDALCIIQDSTDDWREEAMAMGEIYRGAVCTISAVSASNSYDGLFSKCNPLIRTPCRLFESEEATIYAELQKGLQSAEAPLYSRAWVVQERLLSTRSLEYTLDGIRWHCAEDSCSTRHPGGKGNVPGDTDPNYDLTLAWNALLDKASLTQSEDSMFEFHRPWEEILSSYTASTLTYESDRSVAFDGILSTIQSRGPYRFVAGMCINFMPYELLWHTANRPLTSRPVDGVPSWSCTWRGGSFTNDVMNGIRNFQQIELDDTTASIRQMSLKLSEIDVKTSTGLVCPEQLTIECRGPCRQARIVEQQDKFVLQWTSKNGGDSSSEYGYDPSRYIKDCAGYQRDYDPPHLGEVSLLLVCTTIQNHFEEEGTWANGLVLMKGDNGKSMKRIGYFCIPDIPGQYFLKAEEWSRRLFTLK